MTSSQTQKPSQLAWIIGTAVVSRIALNTSRRFLNPFAPVLNRSLGVSLSAITSLIATNQITGLWGIFFAPIGAYPGYRIMMIGGLTLLANGISRNECLRIIRLIMGISGKAAINLASSACNGNDFVKYIIR